jgi:hypothetical protein
MRRKEERKPKTKLSAAKTEIPYEQKTDVNVISYAHAARVYFLAGGDKLDQRFVQSR